MEQVITRKDVSTKDNPFHGVYFNGRGNFPWQSHLRKIGFRKQCETAVEAAHLYNVAAQLAFGEFEAELNNIYCGPPWGLLCHDLSQGPVGRVDLGSGISAFFDKGDFHHIRTRHWFYREEHVVTPIWEDLSPRGLKSIRYVRMSEILTGAKYVIYMDGDYLNNRRLNLVARLIE